MNRDASSILRPLHAVSERIAALRGGDADPASLYPDIIAVADAVEWTLRRLLRDDPIAPLPLRLSALAPDELRPAEVLSEVRQHDLITIQAAAGIHHLFEIRERLGRSATATAEEARHAVQVTELLEEEIARPQAAATPTAVPETRLDEEIHAVPPSGRGMPQRRVLTIAGAAVALLLLIFVFSRFLGGDRGMDEGIALFRSGAYADAAHHFHRYAERNPRDVTPHIYLARIHRRLNRPDLAGSALQEAMRLAPDDPAVHRELGFLLIDTGRFDVAVERFRTAVSMDGESAEGWMGLVLALRRDGREGEAERVLARAPVQVRQRFESQPSNVLP